MKVLNKKKPKPAPIQESIFAIDKRLHLEAIEIVKNFVHVKPIKYLLKS